LEVYNPDAIVGRLGLTGVPLRGVFNGCATAGTAVAMAARAIETGEHDLTIAIGMDKHPRGAFAADPSVAGLPAWYGQTGMYLTTHFFGMKINRYMHDHGITHQSLAQVAAKNFRNASANENAWRRTPLSVAQILASPVLNYPLRQFMYCGPDEGAAAVVLCRADQAHKYAGRPVRVRACALRSRRIGAFEVQSPSVPVGEQAPSPTVDASREAYEIAGIGPQDVAVAQLQDTDAGSEIIHLAENGLCKDGEQERMIADGETEIGGRLPVNTDGGLIGNGEPIGASGLRQIHELVRQLRGTAGARQVPGEPAVGYAHLYGAPGLTPVHELVYDGIESEYDVPDTGTLSVIGLGMIGPTILAHGQQAVKDRYLPAMYLGDVIACQLFSEPEAGSDLASLQTRAVQMKGDGEVGGGEWILEGQKVWTSVAQHSQIGMALCRTDPDAPKHKGITAFLVDMSAPGVDVRPLRQMSGGSDFNEVFLSGVRVPDDHRLGEVNGGWRVALTTLMNERATVGSEGSGPVAEALSPERLSALMRATWTWDDRALR